MENDITTRLARIEQKLDRLLSLMGESRSGVTDEAKAAAKALQDIENQRGGA
jgi:hypothetical protein